MSYYQEVDGVTVDRALYESAPPLLTFRAVARLLGRIEDGGKYTSVEWSTLQVLARRPSTPQAKRLMRGILAAYHPDDWAREPEPEPPKTAKTKTTKTTKTTAQRTIPGT